MKLTINDKMTIMELQQQFCAGFQYLKLEFFDVPPTFNGLPKSHMYGNHRLLASCRKLHNEGTIEITPDLTVDKLERTLWEKFGLSTEVFRKSGNLWIETTLSDSWTLKRQNDEGKIFTLSKIDKKSDEDIMDRDLWE
ncbi:MAG: hypothetical protein JWO06_4107 [Bacteroidota bacterium]|nr:hypothetical protein [Bacteroidota bacterium]